MSDLDSLTTFVAETVRPQYPEVSGTSIFVRETFASRTATLYRIGFSGSGHDDVMVKVLNQPGDAEHLYQSMYETYDILSKAQPELVPDFRPLGYSSTLGVVVMPFVRGKPLATIIQSQRIFKDSTDGANMLLFRCGQMLGSYHTSFMDRDSMYQPQALRDFEIRIRFVLGKSARSAGNLMRDGVISRRYGDYHPGHMIVTDKHNQIVPIDPPLKSRHTFVYRDVACFLDLLFMLQLHPKAFGARFAKGRSHVALSESFLQGYIDSFPLLKENLHLFDRVVLIGYEAFFLKRRIEHLRSLKKLHQFVYYGVPLFRRYYALKHRLLAHLRHDM